ncbi:MAG: hypothetical protein PHE49_11980 [bacterium]|nr:hypothetical protein [bacterium]
MAYKLKTLIVLIILFSTTITFADSPICHSALDAESILSGALSPLLPNTLLTSTLLTNFLCDSSPSIGLKPSDLTLTDAWQGSYLFSAVDDSVKPTPNKSWMITEPLGGLVGEFAGIVIGVPLIFAAGFAGSYEEAVLATGALCIEYPILITYGIWATGKYIEKEKGSFGRTFWGSVLGEAVAIVICSIAFSGQGPPTDREEQVSAVAALTLPFAGGLIGYRLSLK